MHGQTLAAETDTRNEAGDDLKLEVRGAKTKLVLQ